MRGCGALTDLAISNDGDLVGEREGLVLVVRHEDGRRAGVLQYASNVSANRGSQTRVE